MATNFEESTGKKTIRLLRVLAEGCRTHPAYRARRQPGVTGCEKCDRMYAARRTLDILETSPADPA